MRTKSVHEDLSRLINMSSPQPHIAPLDVKVVQTDGLMTALFCR